LKIKSQAIYFVLTNFRILKFFTLTANGLVYVLWRDCGWFG